MGYRKPIESQNIKKSKRKVTGWVLVSIINKVYCVKDLRYPPTQKINWGLDPMINNDYHKTDAIDWTLIL